MKQKSAYSQLCRAFGIARQSCCAYRALLTIYVFLLLFTASPFLCHAHAGTAKQTGANHHRLTDMIDPRIGSEGLGRTFIGPATPFGMVRPGPDCTPSPNSGWLPMPERVDGFSQTHVSGTGGGPKYGNILIQPYCGDFSSTKRYAKRACETIAPAYYSTTFADNGITTEITTAARASAYRITYPDTASNPALLIDAGFFLGESPIPDAREAQQFVGSEVMIINNREVAGYSRIRGGWNNGRAYTVYFHAVTDTPFSGYATWKNDSISPADTQTDTGDRTGALLAFPKGTGTVGVKIGISFISSLKARRNVTEAAEGKSFDDIRSEALDKWESLLGRIKLAEDTPDNVKRMFYTGLYHTMLMPSDRTGENPLWTDKGIPYYDDFYAIWDTYRTSMPLLTIIDPARQAAIVNSLINIWKREGYMPDARSGNANGRTQGGSNADIAVADAFVKGLQGIDYKEALAAMLKDATADPGADHEAHGRGGLREYLTLGYIPWGISRAGNRTVEYSLCDFAISRVAEGLGMERLAKQYEDMSHNWTNLWRKDYFHDGFSGFIMPRDESGVWLDSLSFGHSEIQKPHYKYTPLTFEGPWYTPWWNMFFYEASSWEYSLSMPHDVPLLIEYCGGCDIFRRRLDTFFEKEYYNVNNEPSFMTPCLYHWIGLPHKSTDRIRSIVSRHFNDSAKGLPGNDDSGAMSSWLAFHILGLYPNAGHPYYLINTPMVKSYTVCLPDGKTFTVEAAGLSDANRYIVGAELNGKPYPYSTITHQKLMEGGVLKLHLGNKPGNWGRLMFPEQKEPFAVPADTKVCHEKPKAAAGTKENLAEGHTESFKCTYFLHGQKRRFKMDFIDTGNGGKLLQWGIERNLKWWQGSYLMSPEAVSDGNSLSYIMPEDGNHISLHQGSTFSILSQKQLQELANDGKTIINGVCFEATGKRESCRLGELIEAIDAAEGARILVADLPSLPLIWKMESNPLEIDWQFE